MKKRSLQVLVTFVLVALLFWGIDTRRLAASFLQIDLAFGGAALVFLLVQNDMTTRRWAALLNAFDKPLSHFRMLRIQYMALFAQLFLPSSIGGAAVRTGMLYRSGIPIGVAVNSVVLDRLVAFFGLALLAVVFLPSIALSLSVVSDTRMLIIASSVAIGGALAVVIAALTYRPISYWWALLKRTPLRHLLEPLEHAAVRLTAPRTVFTAFAFSLGGQLFAILAIYMLAMGNRLNVQLLDCILIMPPVMLISALPISIAGWGVREGAMVVAFGLLGVPHEDALGLSLQFALIGYIAATPGALAWFLETNRRALKHDPTAPSSDCS